MWALRPDYAACLVAAVGIHGGPSDDASDAALAEAEERAWRWPPRGRSRPNRDWRSGERHFARSGSGRGPPSAASNRCFAGPQAGCRGSTGSPTTTTRSRSRISSPSAARTSIGMPVRPASCAPRGSTSTCSRVGRRRQRPKPGEVVWQDDAGVTCRRWNWRQCARTRLTPQTRQRLYVIDGLGTSAAEDVGAAGADLVALLRSGSPDADVRIRVIIARVSAAYAAAWKSRKPATEVGLVAQRKDLRRQNPAIPLGPGRSIERLARPAQPGCPRWAAGGGSIGAQERQGPRRRHAREEVGFAASAGRCPRAGRGSRAEMIRHRVRDGPGREDPAVFAGAVAQPHPQEPPTVAGRPEQPVPAHVDLGVGRQAMARGTQAPHRAGGGGRSRRGRGGHRRG